MILYYAFILSLAFVEHPLFGYHFGSVTVEKILAAAVVSYSVIHLALRSKKPYFLDTWPVRAFLVFFAVMLVSFLTVGQVEVESEFLSFHPFNFLLLMFMTISVVDSVQRLRWALLAAVGSITWASLYMLREWQVGILTYGYGYRPGYVVGDPNYFASSALLCLPLAFNFAQSSRSRWIRWGCTASILLILAGIMVSGSRGGAIGFAVMLLIMVWHSKRRTRDMIILALLVGTFLAVSPTSPLTRLVHPTASDQQASDIRLTLWSTAWKMFRAHPLTGVGYGNFRNNSQDYLESQFGANYIVHNQYLELLSETGVPGFLAYVGMLGASILTLGRVRKTAARYGSVTLMNAATGIEVGLIAFSISAFFLSVHFLKLSWLMVSLSACLPGLMASLVDAQRAQQRAEARTYSRKTSTEVTAGTA